MKTILRKKVKRTIGNNDLRYWEIDGIRLFGRGYSQVLSIIEEWLQESRLRPAKPDYSVPRWIATVNPEFVMAAEKDVEFGKILQKTDLNVMDGVGLVWARELDSRFMKYDLRIRKGRFRRLVKIIIGFKVGIEILQGKYKEEVVPGSKLMADLCEFAARDDKKVFFLGGWEDRGERTGENLQSSIFNLHKAKLNYKTCRGRPEISNEEVLRQINDFKPDYLFVAYAMKKQEEWILENLDKLRVGLVMGVGRSFDYYSGALKMAPAGWRKMGLEWIYSLIQEPSRWRRQLALPRFIWKILSK